MTGNIDFHCPPRVLFGRGRIRELEGLLEPGEESVLVVTDPGLKEHGGAVDAVRRALSDREIILFDRVEANPPFEVVERGRELARKSGADVVIGLGGGSPMDAAKGIAALAVNPGELREYMAGRALEAAPLPVIAVPTTSGTGSEVTPYAVFTDRGQGAKGALAHPGLFPRAALIDPELTWSMPRPVRIDTGLDAISHAIEAFVSLDSSPLSDLYAREGVRLGIEHLPGASGGRKEDMDRMAWAAMLGGVAIAQASTVLLHIMGYPLTVFHGVSHGRANAALLPVFMEFLRRSAESADKAAELDAMFERVGGAEGFVRGLGVSTRLADYGVTAAEIDGFVGKVIVKGDVAITPGDVTAEVIAGLYRSAL